MGLDAQEQDAPGAKNGDKGRGAANMMLAPSPHDVGTCPSLGCVHMRQRISGMDMMSSYFRLSG